MTKKVAGNNRKNPISFSPSGLSTDVPQNKDSNELTKAKKARGTSVESRGIKSN